MFVKIDTGYHRSGITYNSSQLSRISSALSKPELKDQISLVGLYSHLGHSYGFNAPVEAIQGLITEFSDLAKATQTIRETHGPLVLSVGATPTATAAQNLFSQSPPTDDHETKVVVEKLQTQLDDLKKQGLILELHAGVYPVLDMQQVHPSPLPFLQTPYSRNTDSNASPLFQSSILQHRPQNLNRSSIPLPRTLKTRSPHRCRLARPRP
jgi:D-serine deaminase-like pyridoxal phosphate-dependent protein